MSERLTALEKRIAAVRKWDERIKKLLEIKQKENPAYSEAEFCRTHNIDTMQFNRHKNLLIMPRQDKVDDVEKAFASEGV